MFLKLPCHFVLELLIIMSGLCIVAIDAIIYYYNIKDIYQLVALLPDVALIIFIVIYICTQVNFGPFYALLKSYRSMIIILSTIVIIVCDITSEILNKSSDTIEWIRTVFDDISYIIAVTVVLFIDCVANITNIKTSYRKYESTTLRVHTRKQNWSPNVYTVASQKSSVDLVSDMYYKIRM